MKRSNAPILWGLFGAGGMLSALLGAMLVFITGFALPLGWLLPPGAIGYDSMLRFVQHPLAKLFILAVIALFAWHAAHRIFHSLHDVHIRTGLLARLACYGSAAVMTLLSAWALLVLGF
ncbi:MAG: fumarate reductase subunit FrdD [Betaproteobacteria bacterium]|nr:fumarate reductase subunit FrdD [Betaproteobacteria bacterium]